MDDFEAKLKLKNILTEEGFPLSIIENPFFLDYAMNKIDNAFAIYLDNGELLFKKQNDFFRNSGKRISHVIRFTPGIIRYNNEVISGVFCHEVTEDRDGNFVNLLQKKWTYKFTLSSSVKFFDSNGFLIQRQLLTTKLVTKKQNGKEGIEAYNSIMQPIFEFDQIYQLNHLGLYIPKERYVPYNSVIIYRRSIKTPDKILCLIMDNSGIIRKHLEFNNSNNLLEIGNLNAMKRGYSTYQELDKQSFIEKYKDVSNYTKDQKHIYDTIMNKLNISYYDYT